MAPLTKKKPKARLIRVRARNVTSKLPAHISLTPTQALELIAALSRTLTRVKGAAGIRVTAFHNKHLYVRPEPRSGQNG